MMGDKKEIYAGDDSTNIQGKNVIVNQYNGLSFQDARDIALQTFKDNFYKLSEMAKDTAIERVEQLVKEFLSKLENEAPDKIYKIENPDAQYSLINAQKQYARTGDKHTLEILVNLLNHRFQTSEGSFRSIVLNESIEVLSKLTLTQIQAITMIFLTKMAAFTNMDDNMDVIFEYYIKIFKGSKINTSITFYEHLAFAGVALHDVTTKNGQKLEYLLWQTYGLGARKENPLQLDDFEKRLQSYPEKEPIIQFWNSSFIKNFTLTSVGIAISVTYLNIIFESQFDLGIWIKD